MDEPALRDIERWKDKIEVRLDNRQVFFLFFGSALVACMLFVLGVIVGKRLESRGRAEAPEIQDPLAVLDRFNAAAAGTPASPAAADQALTFPKALIGGAGPSGGRGRSLASRPTAAAPALSPPPAPAPKPIALLQPKPPAPLPAKPAASPPKPIAPPPAKPVNAAAAAVAAKPANVAAASAPAKPAGVPLAGATGKFTLQLNSFPDKGDADALAKRFAAQGAYVVTSEIPGKGTWYRVRVGNYASSQEALAAKGSFEKQNNVIAYVAGR
jgi:septal ring-binding cell division protein DamX